MNKLQLIFFLLILSVSPSPASESGIAKIDLSLAVSLHPQMSLFDFDRMGFYKVQPGLNESEFSQALDKLMHSPEVDQAIKTRNDLEKSILALEQNRAQLAAQLEGADQQHGENINRQIQELVEKQEKLRNDVADLNYQIQCPDLTSPAATREILEQIEKEITDAIAKVAAQQNHNVVLNTAVPYATGYPLKYHSGAMFGQGVPGINSHIFYSFLATARTERSVHEVPPSRNIINWLELTSFPESVNLLPIKPYPLVLHGGRSILSDVIKIVYEQHQVPAEIFQTVDSVIHKIEKDRENQ